MIECAVDRCTKVARGRQVYCHTHGEYQRRTGRTPILRDTLGRLMARVERVGGCWTWTGPLTTGPGRGEGYGRIKHHGQYLPVHRVSYELHIGPIPPGLTIDHLCRNRACVNPAHLEAVTIRENLDRAPTAPATRNRAKTHCDSGHPFDAVNTYTSPQGKRDCRACRTERQRRHRSKEPE